MPTRARRRGERRRSVEIVLAGSLAEERPTRVPRRVLRSWEGERETESREDGEPRTSNVASNCEVLAHWGMANGHGGLNCREMRPRWICYPPRWCCCR